MRQQSNSRLRATVLAAVTVAVLTAAGRVAAPAAAEEGLTIRLEEFEESGVTGSATVRADGDGTHVSMQLTGEAVMGNHPTHIHTGTCDNFDPNPTFPLTTVVLDEVNDLGM